MHNLKFDNSFVAQLPADPEHNIYSRQVSDACYSLAEPVKAPDAKLIAVASEVADLLEIPIDALPTQEFVQTFSGDHLLSAMQPYAMRYGGHQFGHWAGQLGDGRAINLGEIINSKKQRWALQLKGAGPTPYSRSADGFAVVRSSIREFLCSEAMHHLGIASTRALSLIATGKKIVRDMFYDGNPEEEDGAVVCRVAPSFIRFGNFQIHAAHNEIETLRKLTDFTISTYFPHLINQQQLQQAELTLDKSHYLAWLEEVAVSSIEMVVDWQRVGFVHGVMNTDNMSIHGLTIDYGPYGWLDNFDLQWTPNTTDATGKRYRFENQPSIVHWNLVQLAQAIYPLINEVEPLQDLVNKIPQLYQDKWLQMMANKLGLEQVKATDKDLFLQLEQLLSSVETDMTIFYRALADFKPKRDDDLASQVEQLLAEAYYQPEQLSKGYLQQRLDWFSLYQQRLAANQISDQKRKSFMNKVNPKYILRNYLAQVAIDKAEQGDFLEVNHLLNIIRNPYNEQTEQQSYAAKRPEWAKQKAGCSMLSCSS